MFESPSTEIAIAGSSSHPSSKGSLRRASTTVLGAVTGIALALWSVRSLVGPSPTMARDLPGHLQRIDFGIAELLAQGMLDGWFPGAMLGYQEYLMYGPGLTWMVALVRLFTLGQLSNESALSVVILVAWIAIPAATAFLGRSLGLGRIGAWCSGVLALAVSSFRGGGIEGAFGTGLIGQHVVVPLVLVALASILRLVAAPNRRHSLLTGSAAFTILVTHPISALILTVLVPVVLLARLVVERPPKLAASAAALGLTVLATCGIAAFWLVPFTVHFDLRGYMTMWSEANLLKDLSLLAAGGKGLEPLMAKLVIGAFVVVGVMAFGNRRSRWTVSLLVMPIASLVVAHTLQAMLGYHHPVGVQLASRGFVYYVILALFPVGHLVELGLARLCHRRSSSLMGQSLALTGVALLTSVSLSAQAANARDFAQPVPGEAMRRAASYLQANVPPMARFLVQGEPGDGKFDVAFAARWLGRESGRNVLNPFVPEIAPAAALASIVYTPILPQNVDGWVERARRLAVTHVVVSQTASISALQTSTAVRATWQGGQLVIFELVERPRWPVGSLLDIPTPVRERHLSTSVLLMNYELGRPVTASLAIGWSPKWSASIDGTPVSLTRGAGDRLEIDLPKGRHDLSVEFSPDQADRVGRITTLVTLFLVLAGLVSFQARRSWA